VRRPPLAVRWLDPSSTEIHEALNTIPRPPLCPSALYETLLEPRAGDTKRTALVTAGDEPVMVVGLRPHGGGYWQPVTNWILPGVVAPSVPGAELDALSALKLPLTVGWWRMGDIAQHASIRSIVETPVHRIAPEDRHGFWKSSRGWESIRRARRKCDHLSVELDGPGMAEWVIRNWEAHWRQTDDPDPAVDDRVRCAEFLEARGLHLTITLKDGPTPVAGCTWFVDGSTLVASLLYRDPSTGSLPTGVRLIDLSFELAEERGFEQIDLGGGQDYKRQWAPESGSRAELVIEPALTHAMRRARRLVRGTVDQITRVGRPRERP
jgi:hypothetical protein